MSARLRMVASILLPAVLVSAVLDSGVGLGFHVKCKIAQAASREEQPTHDGYVEPEVLDGDLGLAFDVCRWPVYVRANICHSGTPFATKSSSPLPAR